MARTSTRSSATREQASSPPRQARDRQSESPVGRRTRSTRGQSVESEIGSTTTRGGKRGPRQASVESDASNASAASSRDGRSKKATRAATKSRNLSIVAEDHEPDDEDEDLEEEEDDEDENIHRAGSPSALSGSTAFSERTTHSEVEIASLHPMLAELLPDLYDDSYKILKVFAPAEVTREQVESTIKELKVSGTKLASKLRRAEARFKTTREQYGHDRYIKAEFVFRRLLGTQDPAEDIYRPDAIFHAANLSTLKDFLVIEKESQDTINHLSSLDSVFPEAFLTKFDDDIQFGNSALLDESFKLALDIRTQLAIIALSRHQENETWDPEQILAEIFYTSVRQPNSNLSFFEDTIRNAQPRMIMAVANTERQNEKVIARVKQIHATFRQSPDAREVGDLVDFDQLEEDFPWINFLTALVHWTRVRLDEIRKSIKQQGGVEAITKSFIQAIKSRNSQIDIDYNPTPPSSVIVPRQLQAPAEIVPSPSVRSFYNMGDLNLVRLLGKMKKGDPSIPHPRDQQSASVKASTSALHLKSNPPEASRTSDSNNTREIAQQHDFDDFRPDLDDGYEEPRQEPRPTAEYAMSWTSHSNEKNKENRPVPKPGIQSGSQRVQWDDRQGDIAGPSTKKRAYQVRQESEDERGEYFEPGPSTNEKQKQATIGNEEEAEEESEDPGFERDPRIPDPAKRRAAPRAQRQSPRRDVSTSSKRQRFEQPADDVDRNRKRQQRAEAVSQAHARRQERANDEFDDDEDEMDAPPPTLTQLSAAVRIQGRLHNAAANISKGPQRRTPWSVDDEQRLVDAIEEYGCSWSLIHQNVDFDTERGQVQLKDKARNLKVKFLKGRVTLPTNFANIALGRKEVDAVRVYMPDYEP